MHKSRHVRGANIPADDAVAVYHHVGKDLALIIGVVGYHKGVANHVLVFIFGKIEPLGLLQLVVGGEYLVKLRGNGDGLDLCGRSLYLPSEL